MDYHPPIVECPPGTEHCPMDTIIVCCSYRETTIIVRFLFYESTLIQVWKLTSGKGGYRVLMMIQY